MTRTYGHSETRPSDAPLPIEEQGVLPVEHEDGDAKRETEEAGSGDSVQDQEGQKTSPLQDFLKGLKPDA